MGNLEKKALFVIGSLGVGGAELQMLSLIAGLCQRGWHCSVFVLDDTGPLRQRLEALGVSIHSLKVFGRKSRLARVYALIKAQLSLTALARRWRPDVLQAYLPMTNLIGAIAGRIARVPMVITCRRGLGTHQDRHNYWFLLDRIANRLSHVVTCNSAAVGFDTVARDRISPAKLTLIKNGHDFSRFDQSFSRADIREELALLPEQIGIVAVGNLIPYKGHADLIEAMSVLKQTTSLPVKLFIVGRDDGIGNALRGRALDLGLIDRIVLLGERRDVPRILAAADLFVLPSHEEGSSNALIEAMASGLPIVATDVGGNREALDGGRLGMLVSPRDPTKLATALRTVLKDFDTARARGREAASFARESYNIGRMVDLHEQVYRGERSRFDGLS